MNSDQIKKVEQELWSAADTLRAESKLTAAEYKDPVLGLILLRFAENRFNETLKKIEKKIITNPRSGKKEITKDHFLGEASIYLRKESKYEYLANLPESKDISEDDEKTFEKKVQNITDDHIKSVDDKISLKEKEIMTI